MRLSFWAHRDCAKVLSNCAQNCLQNVHNLSAAFCRQSHILTVQLKTNDSHVLVAGGVAPGTDISGGNQMKQYKYERYTLRLSKDMAAYVKATAERRGIAPTAFIKAVLGEYKEADGFGRR